MEKSKSNASAEPVIEYRKAEIQDTEEIMELVHNTVRKVYPRYYPEEVADFFCLYHNRERIRSDILAGKAGVLLYDGRIVGTGSYEGNHITRLYILPEFQGKGYGTRIMKLLEKQISGGYDGVEVDASLPACRMYEKLGYRTVRHEQLALKNNIILVYDVMRKNIM